MEGMNWDNINSFERFPKLNDSLENVKDTAIVKFLDDGKIVNAETLQKAFKDKGIKGIKAKDTCVFTVQHKTEKNELWLSATNYTNLAQLKAIRESNKNTLVNATVRVTRVSKDDTTTASLKFEKA